MRTGLGALNAEPVERVDRGPVTRVADAVATVIGRHHAHTGLVIIPQGLVLSVAPWLITHADAFADSTRGAGDRETGRCAHMPSIGCPCARHGEACHGTVWAGGTMTTHSRTVVSGP